MDSFKYVVENSQYINISYNNILKFTDLIKNLKYKHWSKELSIDLNEKQWILLVFIIEYMNFFFWKKPKWTIEYKGILYCGSNALFYSIIKEIENNNNFLDIDYLNKLDFNSFKKIFNARQGTLSLLKERFISFKNTITNISKADFYETLFSFKCNKKLLKFIIDNFYSFNDTSIYKGKSICFNKRANLLVNDLFWISPTINSNIENVNNLTGCADYVIPRIFRDFGLISYNDELAYLIDNEIEIKHNSEMEIEIRAVTIYIIELIKKNLLKKHIKINSIELDNIIWKFGNDKKKTKNHHTLTTFY